MIQSGLFFVFKARPKVEIHHVLRLTAIFFSVQDQGLVGVSSLCLHIPVWSNVNVVSLLSPAHSALKCVRHLSILIHCDHVAVSAQAHSEASHLSDGTDVFSDKYNTLQVCFYTAGLKKKKVSQFVFLYKLSKTSSISLQRGRVTPNEFLGALSPRL